MSDERVGDGGANEGGARDVCGIDGRAKADGTDVGGRNDDWRTELVHPRRRAPDGFRSLVPGIFRASTTLFSSVAEAQRSIRELAPYDYGLHGTPTALELATRVAALEGAHATVLAPGGLAAILLVDLCYLAAGDRVLLPENVYAPNRGLANSLLRKFGVEVAYYDPEIGAGIARHIDDRTRLVWCESPGSITMEVQDVPAIAAAAHARGAIVAVDNSYAAGVLFDAFAHGADVAIQALTKYVGGHSDVLLGSVSARDADHAEKLALTHRMLGMNVSPDDCALGLRGLQTLGVRLAHLETSALEVARYLATRPEVATVLHPALPSCPGHDLWRRDFTGSTSLFSFVFDESVSRERAFAFVDRLRLFEIGFSWGGVTSLAMGYTGVARGGRDYGDRLVRLNIGLERVEDLIADLETSFRRS